MQAPSSLSPCGRGKARFLAVAVALLLSAVPSHAVEPDEILKNPALEQRARAISGGLRCLVCQNQSIDDSDAELADDLRRLVRERLTAGDSDAQVVDFVHDRYGDFVLLRPPVKPATWLLWFGPPALLVLGGGLVAAYHRGRRGAAPPPPELEPAERARLERLMAGDRGA